VAKPDTAPDTSATEADASLEQLLQDFENLLRNDPGVDPGIREMMEQQFKEMMAGGPAPDLPLDAVLDPGFWSATVESLQQSGAVSDDEALALSRELDQALKPLQKRESRLAIEFSKRVREEGEESALEWLREQSRSGRLNEADDDAAPAPVAAHPIRSEVVQSRSRRLRAPPRRQ